MTEITINTSHQGWLGELVRAYKQRTSVLLIDDAHTGFNPEDETIWEFAVRTKMSPKEFAAVLIALGLSATGIAMILAALFDPEPTSKLAVLLVGGVVCVLTGALYAIRLLTETRPPNVKFTAKGIEIRWQ